MFDSDHCSDCVVTHLCDPERADVHDSPTPETLSDSPPAPSTAVIFDLDELRAVKLLAEAGLVPNLRHTTTGRAATRRSGVG